MSATLQFFATAPRGLEELLAAELAALGAAAIKLQPSGVLFQGPLQVGYRACLWSRVAGRVLLELGRGPASDAEELYAAALAIDWARHMDRTATLAVDFTGTNAAIVHTTFGAQKVKDAVVDQLRAGTQRPSVDKLRPDLRIHVHLRKRTGPPGQAREGGRDEAVLSIDLSGESLHRRGYREEGAMAPLKENLAAAVLLRAGWPAIAAAGGPLLDPMCGSGTLLIEGAWMAGDRAPGLGREHFGFLGWRGHEPAIWAELVAEASARAAAGAAKIPDIRGYDTSGLAIAAAHRNIEQAGLRRVVHVERFALGEQLLAPAPKDRPEGASVGLVVCNPPYGARVGEGEDLRPLYRELGELLKTRHMGGAAAVLLEDRELGHAIGLRARKIYDLYNGALPVHLLLFKLEEAAIQRPRVDRPQVRSEAAEAFANRLAKNRKQLAPWAAREQISCYRVYDQDIPDYAVAVDVYGEHAHVQEYAAPKEIEAERAESRLRDVMAVVPEVLGIPRDQVHLKIRERSRGGSQYGKQAATGKLLEVREGPARFFVNLTDYLDTGLFLDHRLTRARVGQLAKGRRFLNLFAYTGSATVHAVKGGALATTTVDMSPTYTAWARKNFDLNGITGPEHRLITAECRAWMAQELRRYGLIFLDPPTFSNSKRMEDSFDLQRDHVQLIREAVRLLERGGILVFSNNNRRFRLDAEALAELAITDITRETIPRDFARNPRIHQCWQIERRG
ncbi:MAG: bifunctional 23S rRNA (guanine(2069)-N(7))-methyltransferase RlmK/23S rRNA (guanine(2445)-N(2))-methyltransferase RlmL [Nannocystis sp.]|uniref:bifunctional 23S rRNA (guanine(2069)-N(7))-methyltransferase RlmK/23S rRNA (guanine(2445)-N(2))-methyltransferase RlmL n=1 Tax=Nannocystis sp. TaxID=1962667 RepID=UPI00242703A8|nr:bifunctional 23S rRNA (guanine(2069)-N(7))-methyltransferase RlmK/23S rRNA (guanine(2445)-N(2))-methyltransferase RlmL [Nannocystis sp.]MBK9754907.1 bifunctional 23S rRNA (guanine(2069)-N(7))-methyltransferase RlmK/23S rRNA (guanine(2445)-N(2))-methyltransferase RlmL [Nannocystis sp.]